MDGCPTCATLRSPPPLSYHNAMRYRGRLIKIWFVIMLLLYATVIALRIAGGPFPRNRPVPLAIVFLILLFSQNALTAIWVGSGRTRLPWRLLVGAMEILLAGGLIKTLIVPEEPLHEFCWFLAAQMITILGVLGVSAAAGCRLQSTVDPTTGKYDRQSPSQFTLLNLFAWTTALAVIVGLLRSLVLSGIKFVEPHNEYLGMSLIGALFALPPLSALWAINGQKYATLRGIQFFIIFGLIAFFIISASDTEERYLMAAMFILELLLLVGSLLVFRLEGYRLVRRRRAAPIVFYRDDKAT
jgi:hypothetical protein